MNIVFKSSSSVFLTLFVLVAISTPARARIGYYAKPSLVNETLTTNKQRHDVAKPSDRVNNGHRTDPGQYPFFSQMWWNGNPQGCGGSLIASKWVLTAAHCVDGIVDHVQATGYPEWRVGSYCTESHNCGAHAQTIRSKKAILHPLYNPVIPKWDFALLELTETAFATPVHIDDDSSGHSALQPGSPVTGIGMGYINDKGETSTYLLEVDNHFLPLDTCRRFFTTGNNFDDSVMCTNGANFGMCGGDSGSPVLVRTSQYQYLQVSVTSFGGPLCENHNYPDGSARIGAAIDWIKESVCPSYGPSEGNRPHFCMEVSPQPDPSLAPQTNPTAAPQSNPTLTPTPCVDKDEFFNFKKQKHRSCTKVKGKKISKFCNKEKTNAAQLCPKACGTCS